MKRMLALLFVCVALAFVGGCDYAPQPSGQKADTGVGEARGYYQVPLNAQGHTVEKQNIIDRIKVTTDPAKVMWIHLIGLDGRIISRMAVRCKVTSSGKRLEPMQAASRSQYGSHYPEYKGFGTNEFIEPDGTYGHSDSYVYWFDPLGRYNQWGTAGGLGYLLTDYPIDLKNPIDEITGLYNMNQAAHQWQLEQERILKAQEERARVTRPAAAPSQSP